MRDEPPPTEPVDLLERTGIGPLWGIASSDLNATLLAWPAGHEIAEHVNAELDMLVVVLNGHGSATVAGATHDLARAARCSSRAGRAGASGPARPACATSPSTAGAARCRSPRRRTTTDRVRRVPPCAALIVVGT